MADDFARNVAALSVASDVVRAACDDLLINWRLASYAASLPPLIPEGIATFYNTFIDKDANAEALGFAASVIAKVTRQVPVVSYDAEVTRRLREVLVTAYLDCSNAKPAGLPMDPDAVWQEYLNQKPFVMGLAATLRQSYVTIFATYEDFLLRIIRHLSGQPKLTTSHGKKLNKAICVTLGQPVLLNVWEKPQIQSIRKVRNALVHAGGRITKDLMAMSSPLPVHHCGDLICVFPSDLKSAYLCLSQAATDLLGSPLVIRSK